MYHVIPSTTGRVLSRSLPFQRFKATFTTKEPFHYAAASLQTSSLNINAERLNDTLHQTCSWGASQRYGQGPTETGMSRLSLDDDDKQVREWLVDEVKKLDCKVTVDQMGNIFAVRKGRKEGNPTAMGSHLDTQPTGGRYDGILGIMAGLEVLRTLHDHEMMTEYPLALVDWTNEEGARFPKSIVSSAVWAGAIPLSQAWDLTDVKNSSASMKSELQRIGYLGETECSWQANPLGAHFELHIEQGPILEGSNKAVGIVQGAQAYRWFTLDVHGKDCHTGSTPFSARSDSMLCAAKIIIASNEIAKKHGGLASTGILTLSPGSTNVCPSQVRLSLDIRHPSNHGVDTITSELQEAAAEIACFKSEKGCKLDWTTDSDSAAVVFDSLALRCVEEAAVDIVGNDKVVKVVSGAGHDSCAVSKRCPTAMIFVPSKNGLSHNPWSILRQKSGTLVRVAISPLLGADHCSGWTKSAIGAQVLLQTVLKYDRTRS